MTYTVIRRIKPNTDVTIGYGSFINECKVTFVDNLDVDWQVVGNRVVDRNKYKEEER